MEKSFIMPKTFTHQEMMEKMFSSNVAMARALAFYEARFRREGPFVVEEGDGDHAHTFSLRPGDRIEYVDSGSIIVKARPSWLEKP